MAGLWDILIPTASTNYVKNPSFEDSTLTSWTTISTGGGSYSQTFDNTDARYGLNSLMNSITGSLTVEVYQDAAVENGFIYAVSAYVFSSSIGTVTLTAFDGGSTSNPVSTSDTATGWTRLSVTKTILAGASLRVSISGTATYKVDGVMVEKDPGSAPYPNPSTYFDGDTPNCTWNGTRYASTSTRPVTARNSGLWVDMQNLSAFVTSVIGLGMGDNALTVSEFALKDGGEVRQARIPTRNFTLGYTISTASQSALHSAREVLSNYFRAGRYGQLSPVYFRYRGAASNIIIPAFYEGGMSYVQVGQDGFAENVAARFVLTDSMLERETQGGLALDYSNPIFASAFNVALFDGSSWSTPGSGFNNTVAALSEKYDGTVFAGGGFTDTGGGEAQNYIAKYDGDTWSAVAGGMNGFTHEVKISPDGNVYAGGEFTTAGGVTVNRIAKYDGDTWSALDGGTNGNVYAISIASNGNIYAGGQFTSVGSTPVTVGNMAMYNGDTWAAVPTSSTGADNYINTLEIDADGNVYAGGAFANIGGVAAAGVAKFNGTAWSAMGAGFNGVVNQLLATPDGYIYAGGAFTDTGGGETINSVARWNGTSWEALTTDTLSTVYSLAYRNGIVFIGAEGVVNGTPFVEWNGSNYFVTNINIPGGGQTVNAILPTRQGNRLWISGTLNDTSSTQAAVNQLTVSGSGDTQPKLTIIGAGTTTVYWLENQTTGQVVYLDMTVLAGERVTLDFANTSITSSYGRNVTGGVLGGSDFSTFKLVSGANTISAFAVSTSTAQMILTWPETENGL